MEDLTGSGKSLVEGSFCATVRWMPTVAEARLYAVGMEWLRLFQQTLKTHRPDRQAPFQLELVRSEVPQAQRHRDQTSALAPDKISIFLP